MFRLLKYIFWIIALPMIALSLFMMFGKVPDTKVVSGDKLSDDVKIEMLDLGILNKGERIIYFYSEDLLSFVNYGNLFTDNRVVSYELDWDTDERIIYSALYPEISSIEFAKGEGSLDDSMIDVYVGDEHGFSLVVSQEEKGDVEFYNKLIEKWKANQ